MTCLKNPNHRSVLTLDTSSARDTGEITNARGRGLASFRPADAPSRPPPDQDSCQSCPLRALQLVHIVLEANANPTRGEGRWLGVFYRVSPLAHPLPSLAWSSFKAFLGFLSALHGEKRSALFSLLCLPLSPLPSSGLGKKNKSMPFFMTV